MLKFPLSRIKIDRSFIKKIAESANDAAIVRSLIAMAHNLGLEVIAEGVETAAQAAFLLDEKCEEAQGHFYSEPLSAEEFESYLREKRSDAEPSIERDAPESNFALRRRASGGRRS